MKMKIKPEHLMAGVLAVIGAVFLAGGLKKAGGLPAPAATTESLYSVPEPVQRVLCNPDEHYGDMIFTKHRYPARVGGEVTTVIHYGHSAMAVPNEKDLQWLVNPPSEANL